MQNQPNAPMSAARRQALQAFLATFVCPLSNQTMTDPVIMEENGVSYERSALVNGGVNPETGQPLLHTDYVPNTTMRALIQLVQGQLEQEVPVVE